MKETANRGYPYPECDPPLVKDTADAPLQIKTLAEAIDDDVTALQALAATALNPPSASISANPSTFSPSLGRYTLGTTDFNNTAGMVPAGADGLRAPTDGLYHIVGLRFYSQNPITGGTQLSIKVNGLVVETSSIRPLRVVGVADNSVVSVQFLTAGDLVTLSGVETANVADGDAQLQMTRIAVL